MLIYLKLFFSFFLMCLFLLMSFFFSFLFFFFYRVLNDSNQFFQQRGVLETETSFQTIWRQLETKTKRIPSDSRYQHVHLQYLLFYISNEAETREGVFCLSRFFSHRSFHKNYLRATGAILAEKHIPFLTKLCRCRYIRTELRSSGTQSKPPVCPTILQENTQASVQSRGELGTCKKRHF